MKPLLDELRALAERTAPRLEELERLQRRLRPDTMPEPSPTARRSMPFGLHVVALAAAVGITAVVAWQLPRSDVDVTALRATAVKRLAVSETVSLSFLGSGSLRRGPGPFLGIEWEAGHLDVDVTPHRGVQLAVVTDEAHLKVVGTRFTVERDDFGTRVEVWEGEVTTTCAEQASRRLDRGGQVVCVRAVASLLELAVRRRGEGADAAALALLDAGLAAPELEGWTRYELFAQRINALVDLGREQEALSDIDTYLAAGFGTRRDSFRRLAARLSMDGGDCARAAGYIEGLSERRVSDEALLGACGP